LAEYLSYQSFGSISLNRSAKFFRGCYPQTTDGLLIGENEQGAITRADPVTVFVHPLKFDAVANPLVPEEPGSTRQTRFLFAADRQTLPSFGPPPFQHQAAVLGAHSHEKAVRAFSPAVIGLKRPFSLRHDILLFERLGRSCKPEPWRAASRIQGHE
jgi:hypothetical protein